MTQSWIAKTIAQKKGAEATQTNQNAGHDEEGTPRLDLHRQVAADDDRKHANRWENTGNVSRFFQGHAAKLMEKGRQPTCDRGVVDEDQGIANDEQKHGPIPEDKPQVAQGKNLARICCLLARSTEEAPGDGA